MASVVVFPCGYGNDAVGLLLNHCLDMRSAAPGRRRGLGFRRVQRTTHIKSQPSFGTVVDEWAIKGNLRHGFSRMQALPQDHRNVFPFCQLDYARPIVAIQ
jgi:hypothetical protein